MIKGKDVFKNELITKYKDYQTKEQEGRKISIQWSTLYRDKMRHIAKVFEKNFHEPIDNYISL